MTRRISLAAAVLSAFVLSACDQKESKTAAAFDTSDPKNAPEPARFGPRQEPAWEAPPTPTSQPRAISSAAALASAAPPADIEGDPTGRKIFDGAKMQTTSAPAPKPQVSKPAPPKSSGRTIVVADRKMSIDTDGWIKDPATRLAVKKRDKWRQDDTAYHLGDGSALDATTVPYIVLPLDFKGAQMGDLALVEYNGRRVWAVCGDRGPAGRFGEASPAVASALGIDPDGRSGGVSGGVTYTVFPGTRGAAPRDEAQLAAYIDGAAPALYASLHPEKPVMLAENVTSSSL